MNIEEMKLEQERDRMNELASRMDEVESFIQYCADKGIFLAVDDFDFSYQIGLTARSQGIVKKLFPELSIDKDNLSDLDDLRNGNKFNANDFGYLFGEEFCLLASSYFRRKYDENTNWESAFLQSFWNYRDDEARCYLALDLDRIRLPNDTSVYGEKDYWYGPIFTDITSIKDAVARHITPVDSNEIQKWFIFNNVHSIEIKWDTVGNIRTFQLIEFKDESITLEIDSKLYYPARYLHAEFDIKKGKFTHFDGAIQLFDKNDYYQVRERFFAYGKNSQNQVKAAYIKIFKINDSLSVEKWIDLVGQFCVRNPLISEYFTGTYPQDVIEKLAKTANLRI